MLFVAETSLYAQAVPFVRKELERLNALWYLWTLAHSHNHKNPRNDRVDDGQIDILSIHICQRIVQIFSWDTRMSPDILASNTAFWVQHLLKNPNRKLRAFDPHAEESRVVPVKPNAHIPIPWAKIDLIYRFADFAEQFQTLKKIFSHAKLDVLLWRKFVENLTEIARSFQELSQQIRKEEGNIFVVTNHMTWANIPFLAFCFHHFLRIPKENLYAMVWPAIFTSEFEFEGARRWMNLILTWPDTPRWDTWYNQTEQIQKNALRQALKVMRDTSQWMQVIFLAPSGTSDQVSITCNKMAYPSEGTLRFMGSIGNRYPIYPIWVNDSEVMTTDGRPRKWEVHIKIGEPIRSSVADSIVITKLPSLVTNWQGKPIGEWHYPRGTINPMQGIEGVP
jgi:hypothetical protein